ncbi:MAG: hypothetical protein KY393_07670 [Actinobacteria bacterium]|nr:hypothetical protein [Actinomycetota bacterium]
MRSGLIVPVFATLAALSMLTACDRLAGKESDLSYEQASNRIVEVAESSLRIGLGDDLAAVEMNSRQGLCDDAYGALSDYVYPIVDYEFPLKLLGDDPDAFVHEVEKLWRSNDLETSPSNSSRVTKRFGVSSDGFNFEVFVNRESGIASVGGSGPCVDPPDE